eukprot:3947464-Pyramimonas_sp.AAC.1
MSAVSRAMDALRAAISCCIALLLLSSEIFGEASPDAVAGVLPTVDVLAAVLGEDFSATGAA